MTLAQPNWARRWSDGWVVGLATLGPLGRVPFAPGTWGSAAGVLFVAVLLTRLPSVLLLGIALLLSWAAVVICGEAERRLATRDPGCVILDEFVVMPLCFLGWPKLGAIVPEWLVFALGFAVFRVLDIAKPFGIRGLQHLPGGWGVVADDFAAALGTCALLHIGIGFYSVS